MLDGFDRPSGNLNDVQLQYNFPVSLGVSTQIVLLPARYNHGITDPFHPTTEGCGKVLTQTKEPHGRDPIMIVSVKALRLFYITKLNVCVRVGNVKKTW